MVTPFLKIPEGDGGDGGPCLVTGTTIATSDGSVCVEDLSIGTMVLTAAGIQPVRWIGRRAYSGEFARGNREVLPIRIRQGALADHLPERDLWVSPDHAMYLDGVLIPAALLVNGVSIIQEEKVDEVTYFHLEFDAHTIIYAEGAPTESFVDDESREMFDNAAEYKLLYPDAIAGPGRFCAPRVEEGEELEKVRRRLAERAAGLKFAGEDEPRPVPLHLARPEGVESCLPETEPQDPPPFRALRDSELSDEVV
jgi:hypothetical protein